jgi:hypothetical protein
MRLHFDDPAFNPFPGPVTLRKVRLNQGGYDSCGCYFGIGLPLYRAEDDQGHSTHIRAYDRLAAARRIETEVGASIPWARKP